LFCLSAQDLAANSNVQDAFVIAVEKQARERLERLSALKKIKPVDMTKLSQQVKQLGHSLCASRSSCHIPPIPAVAFGRRPPWQLSPHSPPPGNSSQPTNA
jgi:hypothetical protein